MTTTTFWTTPSIDVQGVAVTEHCFYPGKPAGNEVMTRMSKSSELLRPADMVGAIARLEAQIAREHEALANMQRLLDDAIARRHETT
jgi:hypothetical protein